MKQVLKTDEDSPEYLCRPTCMEVRSFCDSLPRGLIQVAVTSPPYYDLRNYGLPPDIYGGDPKCEHKWGGAKTRHVGRNDMVDSESSTIFKSNSEKWEKANEEEDFDTNLAEGQRHCSKCKARLVCLGLEDTAEEFTDDLVDIFSHLKRPMRDDGLLFVNLGDCSDDGEIIGIPWMFAFAMKRDGWALIKEIIWEKTLFMPEPAKSRPVSSHEHIFMFAKNKNTKYWIHPTKGGTRSKPNPDYIFIDKLGENETTDVEPTNFKTAELPDGKKRWKRRNLWEGKKWFWDWFDVREKGKTPAGTRAGFSSKERSEEKGVNAMPRDGYVYTGGHNMRDVWIFAPGSYPGAHFAVFPKELPGRAIKGGSSAKGACDKCGAPYERLLKNTNSKDYERGWTPNNKGFAQVPKDYEFGWVTRGWTQTCSCKEGGVKPCVVYDPFLGTATTGVVAEEMGRSWVGSDRSQKFVEFAEMRLVDERKGRGSGVIQKRMPGLFEFESEDDEIVETDVVEFEQLPEDPPDRPTESKWAIPVVDVPDDDEEEDSDDDGDDNIPRTLFDFS